MRVIGIAQATHVALEQFHSLGLRDNGRGFAWGQNNFGRLGDGTQTDRPTAVMIGG